MPRGIPRLPTVAWPVLTQAPAGVSCLAARCRHVYFRSLHSHPGTWVPGTHLYRAVTGPRAEPEDLHLTVCLGHAGYTRSKQLVKEVYACMLWSGTDCTCAGTSSVMLTGPVRSWRSVTPAAPRRIWCGTTMAIPAWCSPVQTRWSSTRGRGPEPRPGERQPGPSSRLGAPAARRRCVKNEV